MYKAQEEAILVVGVIVGNPFLTNEGSFVPRPSGGYLISGVSNSRFKRIEYRKVGHYVPKGFLTMNLEKVTKTWSYAFISLRVLVY